MQFSFTSENWNQPQFVTIEAIAEGPVANQDYNPTLSTATISAVQTSAQTNNNAFAADAITINILPDATQNTTVYFAKARGADIETIGFGETTPDTIQVESAASGVLTWFWRIEDNQLIGATTEGGSPIIVLSPMSDAEATAMTAGIPEGSDPVTLTASVELTEAYYTALTDRSDTLTISALPWLVNSQIGAHATVVINNGQPSITLDNMAEGTTSTVVNDLDYFTYTPTGENLSLIHI